LPPASRNPKKGPIIITSGPGRPAPIKKQPLPAYGPYKLPLTDVEKRIVIRKRTPKFVETPRGRIATGGGGVGFFTKGDKGKIMARVRERAIERQDTLFDRAEKSRLAGERRVATPDYSNLRKIVAEKRKEDDDPGFLGGLADDLGLDDFYTDNVLPVVGRAFGEVFETAKETYGVGLVSPGVTIARAAAGAVGKEQDVDKAFDYAAELVKGGAAIAKTQGFDRVKPYVASVIDGAAALGKGGADAVGSVDDFLQTEVPIYDSAKTWADRNAVRPTKDAAVEVLSRVTNQPINRRIDNADEFDRNFIYQANDITQRGQERESAAPQERRDVWIQMALGEYDDPAWDGYESPFTREQLGRMSDYELANAAYGTHTSSISALFEAAKNDFKKIGAMPAALGALSKQIENSKDTGDFRGLGNMAEFLVRQGVSNMVALSKANIYVMTGGQAGNYEDLVRALKAEPILTGLDVASTATIYGKAATFGLKSGGALTKAGALAGRVPGAARAGEAIAGKAGKLAYGERLGAPLIRGQEGPSGVVGAPALGAPLRAAASAGRGLRRIADVQEVQVRDPALSALSDVTGVQIGADRTFRPSSSFFSKASSLLRKRLYEGTNPVSRAIFKRGEVADASKFRAITSAVVEELGTERAAPVVKAFKEIFDESPDLAVRVMWDLSGAESVQLPSGLGGKVIQLTPGKRADELESILAGKFWVKQGGKEGDDVFRFSDESPGEDWKNVVAQKPKGLDKTRVIQLNDIERSNIEQNILLLRRIDEFPEETVALAKERLEAPYREQFGETIGKRIGGRKAPDGSLVSTIETQELQNMRYMDSLDVDIDRRVADIDPSVQARLRSNLGIGAPTGLNRRALAGVARLQDETIARLMPLVGDEFRAEIEKILGEEKLNIEKRLTELQGQRDASLEAQKVVSEVSDALLPELELEVRLLEEKLGILNAENPAIVRLTSEEAYDFASKAVDFWKGLFKKTPSSPDAANKVGWDESVAFIAPGDALVEKTGDATGSNTGGVSGFWTGKDGTKLYVKEYDNKAQAIGEVIANEIYRRLGISSPVSKIVGSKYGFNGAVGNEIVPVWKFDGNSFDPDEIKSLSEKVTNGIVADLWLANWDAVGQGLENIGIKQGELGGPIRIDQGGALFHRAQGELKTTEQLENFDIEDFVTQNPNYKIVINNAGYETVREIDGLALQLLSIHKLIDDSGGIESFVDELTRPFELPPTYASSLVNLLKKRLAVLDKQIKISDDDLATWEKYFVKPDDEAKAASAVDVADTDVPPIRQSKISKMKSALSWYMGSGHYSINNALRGKTSMNAEKQAAVSALDDLFDLAPRTEKPMVLFRGIGEKDEYDNIVPGDTLSDNAFISTSFDPKIAESFGDAKHPQGIVLEIYLPEGSKAVYGRGASDESTGNLSPNNWGGGENEVILPRGTEFYIVDVANYPSGAKIARAYAITPGSEFSVEDVPEFGGTKQKAFIEKKLAKKYDERDKLSSLKEFDELASSYEDIVKQIQVADAEYGRIRAAQEDIDMIAESLMRDVIESGAIPTGARVHIPTLGSPEGARKTPLPEEALAGRGRRREMRNVYTGQFALLGSSKDLERFSGALARNLRIPFIAFESVTRFTDYLMRTGTTIKFSKVEGEFEKQKADLLEAGLINGNGELGSDYVILPINEKTGFLDAKSFKKLDFTQAEKVGTAGRSDAGVDDAQIAQIFKEALDSNAFRNLDEIQPDTRVVILSKKRLESLRSEMEAAAKQPGLLRRITRQWVRFTLTTLPRTPIANVVGSGLLSALGGGLGGYAEAMRIIHRGSAPPELLNNGFAGMFDEGGDLVVSPEGGRFLLAQRYMNYLYYYNVMGEDLARLSVFMQTMKRGVKDPAARKKIDAELAEVMDLNDSFQTLLDAVARGEFANGKALTPELIRIRNDALDKADDFLGGARGLTSRQRTITTIVPFWMWYKHIFKLYFYTLPFKYPGRSLTLNAMARLGAEESARNGFYDSFYEDAIKIGEEVRGQNIYSRGLTTNIFPFNFGGALEYDEGAPGVQFALSNIAPTLTVPARLAGIGIPGAPIIGAGGERLNPGDVFAPGYGEAAVAEAEKLFAPLGLVQSTIAPRSSLAFDAYRFATGQPLPEAQQRGEGEQYAVTPRGIGGLGLSRSVLDAFTRSFGVNIVRTPVRGPVAERRITDEQARLEEEARKRYRESLGLDY
jgi:exoenzyme T